MLDVESIPVVDLDLPEEDLAEQIFSACSTYGFFYVKNHGVEPELLKQLFNEMKGFFSLSHEEKIKIKMNQHGFGYQVPYHKKADITANKGDSSEGFRIGSQDLQGVMPHYAPNQWPENGLLREFKPTVKEYFNQLRDLVKERLIRLVSLSLGLKSDEIQPYLENAPATLLLVHYFTDISKPEEGMYACGEHSDWGLLTALATDGVPGLQIKLEGQWVDVPHKENMFIVNLGDMMERLTNGVYKSTLHRVITQHGKERYSVPCFLGPNTSIMIAPLPQLCMETKAQYDPISFGDYYMFKLKHHQSRKN